MELVFLPTVSGGHLLHPKSGVVLLLSMIVLLIQQMRELVKYFRDKCCVQPAQKLPGFSGRLIQFTGI
jgi:hypothetical protein